MNFTQKTQGKALILMPEGRIDHASADIFSAQLAPFIAECRHGGTPLIFDFSGIEYVSSIGLRALMLAARQVAAQGGFIAVASLTPMVKEVFEVSRFNLVLKTFVTVDDALAQLL